MSPSPTAVMKSEAATLKYGVIGQEHAPVMNSSIEFELSQSEDAPARVIRQDASRFS